MNRINKECNHNWLKNSGSNDKPCNYCGLYPSLKLRFRCLNCLKESCKFCLINKNELPPESSISGEIPRINRYETLELRILYLETILQQLQEKIQKLENGTR